MNRKNASIRQPKQQRSIHKKNQILNAAEKCFAEKGYYKTTSKIIAEEANVSIGSFYAYFKNKKMVFLEIIKECNQKVLNKLKFLNIEGLAKNLTGKKFISLIISHLFDAHNISPQLHHEISLMRKNDPDINRLWLEQDAHVIRYTQQFLESWQEKIRIKDYAVAAYLICNTFEHNIHELKFSKIPVDEKKYINELIDMINRYLFDEY